MLLSVGKSALHWAAAVNNVDAAVVLLKNGANKDLQNNKVCGIKQNHLHLFMSTIFFYYIVFALLRNYVKCVGSC